MLHGLQSSAEMFRELAAQPFLESHSLLAIDFVGFGESSKPDDFSYDLRAQAEAVAHAIDHEKIATYSLIGHSMGGMVGALLLTSHRDRITHLASLEGNLRAEDGDFSREIQKTSYADFAKTMFPALVDKLARGKTPGERYRAEALKQATAEIVYMSGCSIAKYGANGAVLEAFRSSTVKRCLIRGEKSVFGPLPRGIDCEERVIAGSRHFLLHDNPIATFEALREFLGL